MTENKTKPHELKQSSKKEEIDPKLTFRLIPYCGGSKVLCPANVAEVIRKWMPSVPFAVDSDLQGLFGCVARRSEKASGFAVLIVNPKAQYLREAYEELLLQFRFEVTTAPHLNEAEKANLIGQFEQYIEDELNPSEGCVETAKERRELRKQIDKDRAESWKKFQATHRPVAEPPLW